MRGVSGRWACCVAMTMHPSVVAERLARLTTDQRAAATAPPGPVLCVAPAGSGKTTTLVARIAWLIDGGAAPDTDRRDHLQQARRRGARGAAGRRRWRRWASPPRTVRVRTFHALGREILRDAGAAVGAARGPRGDRRGALAGRHRGRARSARHGVLAAQARPRRRRRPTVAADPEAGPIARAFVAYEAAIAARGGLDFDDLVRGALDALEDDADLLARWRRRCGHLLVDEVQDVDRSQLRLALLLAAPANRIFLVGDDDQSIYGWRLADVRRVLALDAALPGLRRVDLEVNHRCPVPVVERAVRLIEHNRERFAKVVRPATGCPGLADPRAGRRPTSRPGPSACSARGPTTTGRVRSWPARTASCGRRSSRRWPSANRSVRPSVDLLVDDPRAGRVARPRRRGDGPAASRCSSDSAALRRAVDADGTEAERDLATALLAWAPPYPDLPALVAAIEAMRARLAELRRDDARLSLATAHSTKGAEFDHVAVVGMEEGRFPSGRADRRGRRTGPGPGGGAAPGLRRLDPRPTDADAELRPGRPLPVPPRGVQPARSSVSTIDRPSA